MANGFKINRQGIRKMTREIEREFAKNPVRIPIEADPPAVLPPATTVNNYNGPVVTVTGDHAQVAWGNNAATQTQNHGDQIAPGYEDIARVVTDLLASLDRFPLDEQQAEDAREAAQLLLAEVVKREPDQSVVRRGATMLRGLLAPIGVGLTKATTEETTEAARQVIDAIGAALPF